ncbi:hypothetical protein ATO6_04850 [Oceanicola sp. 22II-s10i]|nr:hypothetical protein ATO6_04850 [Oceanicola sp. 22II-s10i]
MAASAVSADCAQEIDALFDGPMSSFARPPHTQVMTAFAADGSEEAVVDQWVETPLRYASQTRGQAVVMLIDETKMWSGPTLDGPWTPMGTPLPNGRREWQEKQDADRRANVTEPECLGAQDLNGTAVTVYRFHTKTNPDEFGAWFGGRQTIFVEEATGHLLRTELRDSTAHYQPTPDGKTVVIDMTYDPDLKLVVPDN